MASGSESDKELEAFPVNSPQFEERRKLRTRERAYKAQAHNDRNPEVTRRHAAEEWAVLHELRTGEKVDPKSVYQWEEPPHYSPDVEASRHLHNQERAFKAAAHNPRNSAEERRHAAQEYARIHQQRTGVAVDAEEEFQVGEKLAQRRHPVAEPAGIFTPD